MRRALPAALLLALGAALPARAVAQGSLASDCAALAGVDAGARQLCVAAAQAAVSAQPEIGVLIAGGNPTLGTAGTGGLRLGILPRVSAGVRISAVSARFPDLRSAANAVSKEHHTVAPALAATASLGVYNGADLAPGIGGFGAVDLLGSATWLPFNELGGTASGDQTSDFAYGLGARVGILRESFILPAASLSLMRHHLGRAGYGNVCPGGESPTAPPGGACVGGGDPAEFSFDLTTWSARAVVSKQLLGLGAAAGIGYDRSHSDVRSAVRFVDPSVGVTRIFRPEARDLSQGRWSVFANGSFSMLVARFAVEAGWLQGGDALPEYRELGAKFDPTQGSFFGSIGMRVAL